jgi:UDP-N-acetylmuramyl pentapeptide phosphotransferase/UDP-N-acetylglucosamine-1-phosphate transferase
MKIILFLVSSSVILFILNNFLLKINILINETGDRHQKFASKLKVPLTGGIFLFSNLIIFNFADHLIFYGFGLIILILGLTSDLKIINSPISRFIFQILIIIFFVISFDLKIYDTRVHFLDHLLNHKIFNYVFVAFCILIVINGSNFIDGLNSLCIGYYLVISLMILILKNVHNIEMNFIEISYLIYLLLFSYIINIFNKFFLGDSGSYLLGFLFSFLLIKMYLNNLNFSPFFIILLLWYPCFEILFSILRKKIMNKSSFEPDSNHLHQQIFNYLKKNFKINTLIANIISANIINFYNLIIFIIALNYLKNTQIQFSIILFNIILYLIAYFKLFNVRYKKI